MTGPVRKGLLVLMSAVGAVLLILCVNLANLALGRAFGRARDAAIRTALGASRTRLLGTAFLESVILCAAGGFLGVLFAYAGLNALIAAAPVDIPRLADVRLDARVLFFAFAISGLTAIVCGALPALRTAGSHAPVDALKAGRSHTEGRAGALLRNTLVAVEVAMSAALLVTAGLLISSFTHLMGIDRGFDVSRVLSVRVPLPYNKYAQPARVTEFVDRLLEKVHALPGVESAASTTATPLQGETWIDLIRRDHDDRPASQLPSANLRFISPEYFRTLRMPLRTGRDFDQHDRNHPVAIISNSLAQNLYPAGDALGHKVHDHGVDFDVIGITVDARTANLDKNPPNMLYVPYWHRPQTGIVLVVRTAMEPAGIGSAIRRAVWALDRDVPVPEARTLEQVMDRSVAQRRFQTTLMSVFAAAALALAVFGAYGVVSYAVARRQSEIGIRMALGADRTNVLRMVLRQAMTPVIAGLAVGAIAALWIGRLIASLLFEVSPTDPVAFATASAALTAAALLACLVPARRATLVNPIDALRLE
jgi:putative ABC transport system permease protein